MELVDGRPEAERIEIELTPNVESHGRRRDLQPDDPLTGEATTIVVGQSEQAGQSTASEQRRLFVTAAIVGVLALMLGWLIGRAGDTDEVGTTSATTPVTTDPEVQTPLPGETLPTAATTTTRPLRTTTSTTLAPPTRTLVDLDPRLDGVELTLVGLEQGNVLVELDVATRTLTRHELGRIGTDTGGLIVGDSWIAIPDMAGTRTVVMRDDGTIERVDLGEGWDLLWRRGTDRFWRPDRDGDWNGRPRYEEVDLTGEPTGTTIDLPFDTWPWQVSPEGGLLIEATGSLYSIDEFSIDFVGSGELLGLSTAVAVLWECDEQFHCDVFVTDRLTGEVRPLGVEATPGQVVRVEAMFGWGFPMGASVAPDGSVCAVLVQADGAISLALLDLESGELVEIAADPFAVSPIWSPDSRFVFSLGGGEDPGPWGPWGSGGTDLIAYDRRSGETFPVFSEPVEWERLAARSV